MLKVGTFSFACLAFGLLALGGVGCSTAGAKEKEGEQKKAPALADDAVIGSCQAKDDSVCNEYRNKGGLKDADRTLEIDLTKGLCESELKNGAWRPGKTCEPKGEVGHCVVDKAGSLKHVDYTYRGDEEMAASGCTSLFEGKWESGLADDAVLGRCVVGSSCTEIHNKKTLDAESRGRGVGNEKESCERLEGEWTANKACESAKAKARCTVKGEYRLTSIRLEENGDKQSLADAKELCDISGADGTFERLDGKK